MKTVKLTINGLPVEVPEGTNLLNAAKQVQVKIPSLCYHPDLPAWAACGICVVKVKGLSKLVRACTAPVAEVTMAAALRNRIMPHLLRIRGRVRVSGRAAGGSRAFR